MKHLLNKHRVTPLPPADSDRGELFINAVVPQEIRIAYREGGTLKELYIERSEQSSMIGNIYRGRVCRALPDLQALFVDIGAEKPAFLRMSDLPLSSVMPRAACTPHPKKSALNPSATSAGIGVQAGQSLTVQVIKDPLGTKCAQLTSSPTLVGHYLVLTPYHRGVRVSRRLSHPADRQRLMALYHGLNGDLPGVMIRTAAATASVEAVTREMILLRQRWQEIAMQASCTSTPTLLYRAATPAQRLVRDLASTISRVVVDCQTTLRDLAAFCRQTLPMVPEVADKLALYQEAQPIFQWFNIEEAIQQALSPRVALPSGGYLLIEQTSALTAIDVNSGRFTQRGHTHAITLQTNLEAAIAIAHQLRLRNLGGIIMIDFIDMPHPAHQEQVVTTLQQALIKDRMKTTIGTLSQLGVLEMIRHRNHDSLENRLCGNCPNCHGRGTVKTLQTICHEILREILRLHRQYAGQQFLLHTSPIIHDALLHSQKQLLMQAETATGKPIHLQVESRYQYEQFKVVVLT